MAPRCDCAGRRTLQGARLRLSRLLVCAVDGTRAAARVAGSPSADDMLPRDRWIRGGRPRAAGGDDPHRPPRIAVARRQLPRQLAGRLSIGASDSRERIKNLLPHCGKIAPPLDATALHRIEERLKRRDVAAFVIEPISINLGVLIPENDV